MPMPMPTPAHYAKLVRVRKYRRRSTNEENQPYSIEAQDARLDPFIQSQEGWVFDGEYADDASGATLNRDGLQKALRDAKAGLYDVLVVYRIDRLTRSIRGLLDIVDALNEAGVALVSASEHFDTHTPVGRMVMQILAVFAEFERAIIIDRVVAGMERKAAAGGWTGGTHPVGYTAETVQDPKTALPVKTGRLLPDEHAPVVEIIFEMYGRKRLGARAIANWLNEQGYFTSHGKPWGHTAILKVLRNRTYVGEIFFRETWYPAPHKPLIDGELFDLVQAVLIERGEDHSKRASNDSDYALASLVRCALCDSRYLGNVAHGRSRRYRYYTCFRRHRFGTDTCPAARLPADALEQAVLDALLSTYERTDLFHHAVLAARQRARAHTDQHQAELRTVDAELRKTNAAIKRYLQAFEHQTLPEDICGARLRELRDQLGALQARKTQLKQALAAAHVAAPDPAMLAILRARVREAVISSEMPARKALLRTLVAEIRVEDRNTIRPFFWVPTNTSGQGAVRNLSTQVAPSGFEPPLPT